MVVSELDITEKQKRDLVRRVLQSPTFSSSRALQSFLQFVTDHALTGDLEAIKEQRIGIEVLGRKSDYDPAVDNIVRVRAHELRQKLAKYFSTEGVEEAVIITIPKGSYVPAFSPRQAVPVPPPPQPAAIVPAKPPAVPQWIPWTLAVIFASVAAFLLAFSISRTGPKNVDPSIPAPIRDLWAQFFHDRDREPTVVSADSGFALWQDITGQNIELGDYITRKFVQQNQADSKLNELASRLCTSPADVNVALEISEVSRLFGGRLKHRYARDIAAWELRSGNSILMGSRRSNPWVGLFESRMNFVLMMDNPSGAPHFHNKAPQAGEAAEFAIPSRFDSDGAEKRQMVSYGVAALVPNLSGSGLVLIIEGLNMEGTAAVGDVVTNPDKLSTLLRKIGHKPGTPVKPFEAVMKLTSIPGSFAYPEVIAARYSR